MKTIAAAVLNSEHYVSCWKLRRTDGTVMGFTSHDQDLVIDAVTYQAVAGFTRSAYRQSTQLSSDNQNVVGAFDSAAITEADLAAGLYFGAEVWYFEVDWQDTSLGTAQLDYGILGEVTRNRLGFSAEFDNLSSLMAKDIGFKYGRACRHTLGDSSCGIELLPADWSATDPVSLLDARKATVYDGRRYVCTTAGTTGGTEPTWDTTVGNTTADGTAVWTCYDAYTKQGTLTAVTSNQQFTDSSRTEADNWFAYGKLTFTSGLNNGLTLQVKKSLSTGVITMLVPFPFTVSIGDTYDLEVGCNHQLKLSGDVWGTAYTGDCRAKFNLEDGGNAAAYGGFPEQTGNDQILAGPQ